MKLKIMTYNIASGHYYGAEDGEIVRDLQKCAEVIKDASPDFCGINEINIFLNDEKIEDQPAFLGEFTGLKNTFFGKTLCFEELGRDYGNAVISKHPIISAETISVPDPARRDENVYYETRGITKVKLDIAGGITVLQTHFGLAVGEQQNSVTELCRIIDMTEGPIILMGDFNIRPSNFLLKPLKERLFDTALVREGEYLKTFPSYKCDYPDCKIDYIFVSRHFKTISVDVPQLAVSDHLPYIAEIEMEGK